MDRHKIPNDERMRCRREIARQLGRCQRCFHRDAMPRTAGTEWPRQSLCGVCAEEMETTPSAGS